LAEKTRELFDAYDVRCESLDAPPSAERLICGILGFTGEHLCGSVVLSAAHDAVACSNPIGDGATRGWVAELTNQLVGRFKNELFRRGVDVAMSVPVVLTATQLTPVTDATPACLHVSKGALSGSVTIWLEIEAEADLVLSEPTNDTAIAAEGESFMF
jgi:CheY-specific phosphatase CheX